MLSTCVLGVPSLTLHTVCVCGCVCGCVCTAFALLAWSPGCRRSCASSPLHRHTCACKRMLKKRSQTFHPMALYARQLQAAPNTQTDSYRLLYTHTHTHTHTRKDSYQCASAVCRLKVMSRPLATCKRECEAEYLTRQSTHTQTHTHTCTHTCAHTCMHTRTRTRMHANKHVHTL